MFWLQKGPFPKDFFICSIRGAITALLLVAPLNEKVHLGEQKNIGQQLYVCLMKESIWSSCFDCSCHKPKSKVLECLHQNKSVAVGVFIDKLIMPHVMIMEAIHMHISYTNVG